MCSTTSFHTGTRQLTSLRIHGNAAPVNTRTSGGTVAAGLRYADLDPGGRPGLGARAHAEFGVPVIGVAKSAFRTATHAVPVLRGTSARPLYVTAAGMPRIEAADLVRRMAGRHRLPDALRRADALARHGLRNTGDHA